MRSTKFISGFKEKFFKDELTPKKHYLKNIQNYQNPLFQLISIDKQQQRQNGLIKELIVLATSLIQISEQEILENTFYLPSRDNLTYAILFNESLRSLTIYTQTINCLNTQWKRWRTTGVVANDVWTWKGFTREQTAIVREIWALVTQVPGKKYQLDALFDATHRDMKAKLETNEKVVTCLNAYCHNASDKDRYYTLAQDWQNRFEREIVQSIEIPKILKDIVPFANELNQYVNTSSWKAFLTQRTTINGKIVNILSVVYIYNTIR